MPVGSSSTSGGSRPSHIRRRSSAASSSTFLLPTASRWHSPTPSSSSKSRTRFARSAVLGAVVLTSLATLLLLQSRLGLARVERSGEIRNATVIDSAQIVEVSTAWGRQEAEQERTSSRPDRDRFRPVAPTNAVKNGTPSEPTAERVSPGADVPRIAPVTAPAPATHENLPVCKKTVLFRFGRAYQRFPLHPARFKLTHACLQACTALGPS